MQTSGISGQNQSNINAGNNVQANQFAQSQTAKLNDQDLATDILSTEKHLTNNYSIFVQETSNQILHDEVFRILQETDSISRNLFNIMYQKGWYQLIPASSQEISQSVQKFQSYQSQLPY